MLKGAPYAALSKNRIKTMMDLLEIKKGKKLADLGSGDGRITIEAAKKGADAFGYEINPLLYLISTFKIKKSKSKAKVFLSDYWKVDLSSFDNVSVYGAPQMMGRLEKKLLKELKKDAKVVSNHYPFPNWKYEKKENDVYLYIKS